MHYCIIDISSPGILAAMTSNCSQPFVIQQMWAQHMNLEAMITRGANDNT